MPKRFAPLFFRSIVPSFFRLRRHCTFSLASIQRKSYQKERSPLLMHLLKSTASLPCAGLSGRHDGMPLLRHSLMPSGGLLAYTLPGKDALIFLRRSIKGGFIPPRGPVNYMFVHALQADPSKADLSPHGPGQLHVCACFTGRSIKGGFIHPQARSITCLCMLYRQIHQRRIYPPTGPVNYMFVHALQADPSKAGLSPHRPGQLHVCRCPHC